MTKFEIVDVDFWECDAFLVVDGKRHFFQFSDNDPSLANALTFLFLEGKIEIKQSNCDVCD